MEKTYSPFNPQKQLYTYILAKHIKKIKRQKFIFYNKFPPFFDVFLWIYLISLLQINFTYLTDS